MAIFSCVSPDAHSTLSRSDTRARARPGLANVDGNRTGAGNSVDAGGLGRVQSLRTNERPQSWNGQAPLRALSTRDLSRRNGAKLQKRQRVAKSMIGVPANFVHCSHLDKTDAKTAFASKGVQDLHAAINAEMPDVPCLHAERMSTEQATNAEPVPSDHPPEQGADGVERPALRKTPSPPHAAGQGRRKAPPPITPSIIKAAGLPQPRAGAREDLPTQPAPASESDAGVSQGAAGKDAKVPDVVIIDRQRRSPLHTPAGHASNQLAVPGIVSASSSNAGAPLPPTVSSIRRDIEKLLDGPMDGMPSLSGLTDGLPGITEGSAGIGRGDDGTSPQGTIRGLALSPNMENMVHRAVSVEDAQPLPPTEQPGSNAEQVDQYATTSVLLRAVDRLKAPQESAPGNGTGEGEERNRKTSSDTFATALPSPATTVTPSIYA